MSRTAYLVGVIDTHTDPPTYSGCGIYSEPRPTVRGFSFVITEVTANDYRTARAKLLLAIAHPLLAWTHKSLKLQGEEIDVFRALVMRAEENHEQS